MISTSVPARPSPDISAGQASDRPPVPSTPRRPRRSMPTRVNQTCLAAAAMLAGASSLTAPVTGHSWVLPLVEVVAVIWLVGVGGRLTQLPAACTVVLQVTAFLIALTSLFTSSGIGGVLPNSSAIAEARALLADAFAQVAGTSPPTPSTPALSLLISLAIGCAALAADIFVTVAKSPALVGLLLLCLYSFPASVVDTMLPWYSFAAPAVLYLALLSLSGHGDRLIAPRDRLGIAVHSSVITALALVAALAMAASVTTIGTTGSFSHTRSGSSNVGLSPFASLQGSLKNSTPVNVLTATGLPAPDYFRTVALTTWTANRGWSLGPVQADVNHIAGALNAAAPAATGSHITVTTHNLKDRFLPILAGTSAITGLADNWSFDSALNTVFRPDNVTPGTYVLTAVQNKPDRAALEADTVVPAGADLAETGALSPIVQTTAQRVTVAQAGPFNKAAALQQWFTDPASGFTYSLDVPAQDTGDALVDFLTYKRGFCQQFASAMAIMLRSLHIPARVVIGFSQGVRQANGSFLVTSRNAHAWVEVKFVDNGWVRFDPTPTVNGQGGQQGFTENNPDAPTSPPTVRAPTITAQGSKLPREQQPAQQSPPLHHRSPSAATATQWPDSTQCHLYSSQRWWQRCSPAFC